MNSTGQKGSHCFELRTANVDYMVGHDTPGEESGAPPSTESGIGLHLARSWETAIRQALMPVTPQNSLANAQNATGVSSQLTKASHASGEY